ETLTRPMRGAILTPIAMFPVRWTTFALAILFAGMVVSTSGAASITTGATTYQVDYRAAAANLDVSVSVPGGAAALDGSLTVIERIGAATRFTYDETGRLVLADTGSSNHAYSYDQNGHLVVRADSSGGTTRYTYDALGRLTSAGDANLAYSGDRLSGFVAPDGTATEYLYDDRGNLIAA